MDVVIMSQQKSKSKYIGIPVGIRLSEAPLPIQSQQVQHNCEGNNAPADNNLETCLWHSTGECQKSGLRDFVKKEVYDGKQCKCYAYIIKER